MDIGWGCKQRCKSTQDSLLYMAKLNQKSGRTKWSGHNKAVKLSQSCSSILWQEESLLQKLVVVVLCNKKKGCKK